MAKHFWKSHCPLCDRLAGKIDPPGGNILENDCWLVEHTFTPVCMPGLLIATLKRHCENPAELTHKEVAAYYKAIASLSRALKTVFPAKSFRIESLPDGIAHVHFNIIPLMPTLQQDPVSTYVFLRHKAILAQMGEQVVGKGEMQIDQVSDCLREELRSAPTGKVVSRQQVK